MSTPLWIIAGCLAITVVWKSFLWSLDIHTAYRLIEKRKKVDAIFKKHFDGDMRP